MSWFSRLLGVDKGLDVLDNNLGRVSNAIDKFTFTEQEKSEHQIEGFKAQLDFIKANNDQNSTRSVTRRILAIMLLVSWSAQGWAAIIVNFWTNEKALFIFEIMKVQTIFITMVFGFYFGYYAISNIVSKARGK